jgi:hypothetical protein
VVQICDTMVIKCSYGIITIKVLVQTCDPMVIKCSYGKITIRKTSSMLQVCGLRVIKVNMVISLAANMRS